MSKLELLYRGRFLELVRDGRWEYVRRLSNRGAVFVIATTPARELVLVEQDRIPVGARCIELPAGILGDEALHAEETPERCGLRELLEETGYHGREARLLTTGPVAPGLTSEKAFFIRITGLDRAHEGGGIDGENITVHAVPLDGIDAWLDAQRARGAHIEPRIYAALYFLRRENAAD